MIRGAMTRALLALACTSAVKLACELINSQYRYARLFRARSKLLMADNVIEHAADTKICKSLN